MNDAIRSYHASSGMDTWRGSQAGLALLGMMLSGLAMGQEAAWRDHPGLTDRWTLQIGAYVPKVDTTARLNSPSGGRGASVSFEEDIGLKDRETAPSILGSVRLGERWKIEGEYFSLSRSGSKPVNRTINWGDRVFTVGTVVSGDFESDVYRLSAGYSFVKDNQRELGIAVGAHVTDFVASLGASGTGTAKGDTLAPLPTIGVYGAYAFTPRWLLSARLDYFSLNYDDYDGSLVNFNIGVDYRFTRHFGVGVAFRHVDYDLTVTKSKYNGAINYKFNGPVIYGVANF